MVRELNRDTNEALTRLGRHGIRAAEMLAAAKARLDAPDVRAADIVCYCCREAFDSLLRMVPDQTPSIGKAAELVVTAAATEPDAAPETSLGQRLEELRRALDAQESRNQRRLAAVIENRAGVRPVRFRADLYSQVSSLIGRSNAGLHAGADLAESQVLYEGSLDAIERLFAPITRRLERVDELASMATVAQEDIEELEQMSADPRVLDYFFQKVAGPVWLEALEEHELMTPNSGAGLWSARPYLAKVAETDEPLVVNWLEARIRSSGCERDQAAAYVGLARSVGAGAMGTVLAAVTRFPDDGSVILEATLFVDQCTGPELSRPDGMRLLDRLFGGNGSNA